MSVQLIVYPQNYQGFSNSSNPSVEMITDGSNFVTVGQYVSSYPNPLGTLSQQAITALYPIILNTWYSYFNSASGGTPAGGSVVVIYSDAGILQNLTNLTAGQVYSLEITYVTGYNATTTLSIFNQSTLEQSTIITPTGLVESIQFTAPSANDTIVSIDTTSSLSLPIIIANISITATPTEPSDDVTNLNDGQVIVDLYEDEDLPLTLSVDDFKNVAEKVQSYSKAFNLPATKRNNQIFDHIFEVTRDVASSGGLLFNPYKRTKCVLKQDGFILFDGYLRMLDVTEKDSEISYNVNLYSEVVALADTLQDREFSDLVFTELEHAYNLTNIQLTWSEVTGVAYTNASTSGFRTTDSVKYPFVDWNHNYILGNSGNPVLQNLESSFRPFINIKYIIDRIFQATDFTYESSFFNTTDFKRLYMDFNWGANNAPVVFTSSGELTNAVDFNIPNTYTTLPFDEMDILTIGGNPLDANFGYSAGVFTAQEDGQVYTVTYNMDFKRSIIPETLDVQWIVNGVPVNIQPTQSNSFTYSGSFTSPPLTAGDTILCQAKSSLGVNFELDGVLSIFGVTPWLVQVSTSVAQTTDDTLLGTLRGETGQWDFLKGLLTMFNLVTLPDEDNPNNIKIETYTEVFINNGAGESLLTRGIQHDWTDKIDVSEMKLTPLTDLNKKTIFKFVEDDDDYAFNQYKNLVGGHLYGSKKYDASNEFNILDGEDEVIAEPFAATVVKPLMSQYPDFIVPSIYSYSPDDDTSEGFDNSPRIMYNNGIQTLASNTYSIPAQNGVVASALETQYLQFSHLTDIPTIVTDPPATTDTFDFNFGECQLMTGVGDATPNNLFNFFWLAYYNELYNPNTRTMTIKVNLSPADINTFQFNDKVLIKNRVFRVNKIDYKPNDLATVEFILIP